MSTTILYTGPDTAPIEPALVTTTYNGQSGCACGCGGTYAEPGEKAFARRIAKVNAAIKAGTLVFVYVAPTEHIYCLETEQRATRLYVKAEA
jgi:hypothetical protein